MLLLVAGCAAIVACGVEPTTAASLDPLAAAADVGTAAKPVQCLIAYGSARGGVSQMSPMKADG